MICFLSVNPTEYFYNFIKRLQNDKYDVCICVDDIHSDIPGYDCLVKVIRVDSKECEAAGFKGSVLWCRDRACSRDKALYYFSVKDTSYSNIWMIEDDVFIPNIHTIPNIDARTPHGDLLTASQEVKNDKDVLDWHWSEVNRCNVPLPWVKSMICAIRISRRMLYCIKGYATKHRALFLDEALFTTIALHNNLEVVNPTYLSTIVYQRDWLPTDINVNNLYHPVKGDEKQKKLHAYLTV